MEHDFTEETTSRFVQIQEDGRDLRLHYNDCDPGTGGETVLMLHGSGPGASGWANFNRRENIWKKPLSYMTPRIQVFTFPCIPKIQK